MRSTLAAVLTLALLATGCTSDEPADTESLSAPDASVDGSTTAPPVAQTASTTSDVSLRISAGAVAAGDSVTIDASGFGGDITWGASAGTIEGTGSGAVFTPPEWLGEYEVTAESADDGAIAASAVVSVTSMTLYTNDFSEEPGDEWDPATITTSPSGESFLGEISDDRVRLWLPGLPTHDEITISFDLYILRSWDGLASRDEWSLELNDERIIDTTFSNDEKRQAWPGNYPYSDNAGRSGAAATDTLGYWYETEDNLADATYRITRTYGHEGPLAYFDFAGSQLDGVEDEAWGLDNVVVSLHRGADGPDRPETSLAIGIADNSMVVSGQVSDPSIERTIEQAAADWFGGWNLETDLTPVEGSIEPVWMAYRLPSVFHDLRNARDVTLTLGLKDAVLEGSVLTERYREELVSNLRSHLGVAVAIHDQMANAIAVEDADAVSALSVPFAVGSAELPGEIADRLDAIVGLVGSIPTMRLAIIGHTDLTGSIDENEDLSWERAEAIRAYLLERGLSDGQLTTHGQGSEDPLVEGTDEAANAANRRVSFWIHDG